MDSLRRQQTLQALGLTRWVRRDAVLTAMPEPDVVHASSTERVVHEIASAPSRPETPAVTSATATKTPDSTSARTMRPEAASLPLVPEDWEGLRAAVADCRRCKLCETRTHTVFGVGPQTAPLMIVGEGPGAQEDATGEAFVGRAGKLLDEMLRAIGYSRDENTFIANVVKCRPPGNRDPEADEVAACRAYLDQQVRLLKPRLIVGLGRVAAHRLLDTKLPMSKLRGDLHEYRFGTDAKTANDASFPVMLTYHPAYLMRSPREKAKAWADLKQIRRFLDGST